MLDTIRNKLDPLQIRAFKEYGRRVSGLGVNLALCDADAELLLMCSGGVFESNTEQLTQLSRRVIEESGLDSSGSNKVTVWHFGDRNTVLAALLTSAHDKNGGLKASGVVLVDLGDADGSAAAHTDSTYWMEMLRLLVENFQASTKADQQIEMVGTELAQTYEELVLLHKLSTNMRVTEQDANFLQMACDSITEIIPVEGIAVLLEKVFGNEQYLGVAAGSGLIDIDDEMAAALYSRLAEEISCGKESLLDSEVDAPFKYDWPENIRNIIAVPLCGMDKTDSHLGERAQDGSRIIGLMVAINRVEKQDFDSIDLKLFLSVANSCAVFIENGRLFTDLKELFIGSLKALTNSIDAKDQYTRGHSERVALISHWIAERYSEIEPLEEEHMHRIYLAGLLHDIGKIGVDETVLRKKGKLTDSEYECIKKHPSIGAGILREIKQMRDIVPGVLCHHERIDGRGYPGGLVGDEIPLVGKIVGLADSFDAMTSKRTYRDAMSVKVALAEIEKGLGTQFDEKVGRVFLESNISRLWAILQGEPGISEAYNGNGFTEYGAAAVGTLIR
ncbi:MAG: HD domain-containing protein [Sedimentisphaerales bacterium]|nr:HD domain-containing protein [Sedimentisphaerales bacterium]